MNDKKNYTDVPGHMMLTFLCADPAKSGEVHNAPTPLHVTEYGNVVAIYITLGRRISRMAVNPNWITPTRDPQSVCIKMGFAKGWEAGSERCILAFRQIVTQQGFTEVEAPEGFVDEIVQLDHSRVV